MKTMTMTSTATAMMMLAASALAGCAADAGDDAEADAKTESEIQRDQLFATATVSVDGYGIVGQPAGDPACADLFVGTADPYCQVPFERGATKLGYATHRYQLARPTPASNDGFASVAGKATAIVATPKIEGLSDGGGQRVTVRAHRLIGLPVADGEVGRAAPACKAEMFIKAPSGKWLPRLEKVAGKIGASAYADGTDVGDNGVLMGNVCGVAVMLLEEHTALSWDATKRAYVGAFAMSLDPSGARIASFSHGAYQLDFLTQTSVSMPAKKNAADKPVAFELKLSHR